MTARSQGVTGVRTGSGGSVEELPGPARPVAVPTVRGEGDET